MKAQRLFSYVRRATDETKLLLVFPEEKTV